MQVIELINRGGKVVMGRRGRELAGRGYQESTLYLRDIIISYSSYLMNMFTDFYGIWITMECVFS